MESCVYHGVSWVTRKSVIMLMRLLWAQAEIISLTKVGTNRLVWYRLLFQMKTSNGKTTRSINVALDLGFFNNRITDYFEWFDKKTSDILMQLAMPGIFLGSLNAPYQNVGAVRESWLGMECELLG